MGVAWTRLGTVTVTAGSVNVSGVDTRWQTAASIGDAFQGPDGKQYEVAAITSDTALQLRTPYQGATAAGQAYAIMRIVPQGSDAETMALLRQVLNLTDTQLSAFMAWADSQAAVSISDGETNLVGLHGLRKLMADIAAAYPKTGGAVAGPMTVQGIVEAPALAWSSQRFNASNGVDLPLYGVSWSDFSAGTIGSSAVVSGWGGVRLYSAGAPRLVVSHGGDVGIGTESPSGTLELRRDDMSGPSLVLNNRVASGAVHKFGSILFGAARDVSNPSFPAGIWAEGTDPLGNRADLVFGATVDGLASHPAERLRIHGGGGVSTAAPFRPGQFTLATLPAASAYGGYTITVSNAAGGSALCLSDGVTWINVRTGAAVS